MTQQAKTTFSALVRADNWAYSKIPPLLAVGYGLMLINELDFRPALRIVFFVCVCICSVAAYGHIINDIFDIQQDLAIGKKNVMARLSPAQRLGSCLVFIVSGFSSLFFGNLGVGAAILLILNYGLPTLYSLPPFRLKERGLAGVMADALGAHAIPTLFIALSFMHVGAGMNMINVVVAISAVVWAIFAGLRGIMAHQILDQRNDRRTHVMTFAGRRRRKTLRTLVLTRLFPFEVAGIVCFLGVLLPFSPILAIFLVVYLAGEFAKTRLDWKLPLFYPEHPRTEPYFPLLNNEFYEVWLPCALVSQLVFKELSYGLILIFHIVVFRTIIKERLVIFGRLLHDIKKHILEQHP